MKFRKLAYLKKNHGNGAVGIVLASMVGAMVFIASL